MNKHEELEKKIGRDQVLVVNSTMEVKDITTWQKVMPLILEEKAYVLLGRTDGAVLRSAYLTFEQPLVICLVKYVQRHNNVFDLEDDVTKSFIRQRDNFTCVYCGKYGNTVDHIHPKSRGGKNTWGNLCVACSSCNGLKADRTPEEAGLKRPVIRSGFVEGQKIQTIQGLLYEVLESSAR